MSRNRVLLVSAFAATLFASAAQAQTTKVCASGYISQFTAAAGTNSGGKWAPSMKFTIAGSTFSIGKDGQAPSASEAWDTLRSAAQAVFLSQVPVQLLSNTSNCPTSADGAQAYSIHMCVNASDCGVSTAATRAAATKPKED